MTRMDRALHRDLVKRRVGNEPGTTNKPRMLQLTWEGAGRQDAGDGRVEDVYGDIASATVHSEIYHEYVHLVRTADGWKIANALWRRS